MTKISIMIRPSYKVTITVIGPYDYAASVIYEKNGQAYHSLSAFANAAKPFTPALTQTPPVVTQSRPLDNVPKTENGSNLALWDILEVASLLSLLAFLTRSKTHKASSRGKGHRS